MNNLFSSLPDGAMTLTQLTAHVGNALRMRPELQHAWVTAELSDVRAAGGHCYMELVEKNSAGQTIAKLRANIWRSTFIALQRKFSDATGRNISTGMKVMVQGSVTHHAIYGISFNITDIDPSYTLGDIERLRREILATLEREGVAEVNKSLLLPPAPQRIAVISAAGTAGYGDFCNQLANNSEGFVFYPHLFPAVMQGDRTAPSVMAALDAVEAGGDFWDAVVILRGGGATTDLISFDNLELARRVATFPIPVIVGIGHERDNTALDYVANTRCKTPTAVAEFLIDTLRTSYSHVKDCVNFIIRYSTQSIRGEAQRVMTAGNLIGTVASTRVARESSRLDALTRALPLATATRLSMGRQKLEAAMAAVSNVTGGRIRLEAQRVGALQPRVIDAARAASRREHDRLLRLESLLNVLSPEATLRRGYSITMCDGHAVTSIADVAEGSTITTRLPDGTVTSTVNTTTNGRKTTDL